MKVRYYKNGKLSAHRVLHENPAPAHVLSATALPRANGAAERLLSTTTRHNVYTGTAKHFTFLLFCYAHRGIALRYFESHTYINNTSSVMSTRDLCCREEDGDMKVSANTDTCKCRLKRKQIL